MTLLKKVSESWYPSENPGLKIGDTLEVTDYQNLVRTGLAVMVDKFGNELELLGQIFTCPICFAQQDGLVVFNDHISSHLKSNKAPVAEVKPEAVAPSAAETLKDDVKLEVEKQNKAEAIKAQRLAALAKAREAKKAKIKK